MIRILILAVLLGAHCKTITTKIEIDAPVEKVWSEFENFPSYPTWNPFLRVSGDVKEGETIAVEIYPVGGDKAAFQPKVLKHRDHELLWRGRFLMPGIFTGEHGFRAEATANGKTLFYHTEEFNGLLVPFFSFEPAEKGFEAMNRALKDRSENAARRVK